MLTIEELRNRTHVIQGERADRLRAAYIDRFVDVASDWYRAHIATRRRFKDGVFYIGYLWDCLCHWESRTADQLRDERLLERTVYVFWDLHSAEQEMIENYWKFPKEAVLQLKYRDVLDANLGRATTEPLLPEDIYLFDDSMQWSIVLTHETDADGLPIYFKASPCEGS